MKKHKKLLGLLLASVLTIGIVGCTNDNKTTDIEKAVEETKAVEHITLTHKYGEVTVPKNPTTVAVSDFGILDTLDSLGVASVKGLPTKETSMPEYLRDYSKEAYINIGSLKEPDFETLYEMAPDIIFISTRQSAQYEELSKIAPVIYMEVDKTDYMGSLQKNVSLLGEIFNKEVEAKEMLEELTTKVDEIEKKVEEKGLNALITMVSKGEVSVFGEGSRFGMIYDTLGFESADEKIEEANHGQVVTFEYLLEVDPDYLFVVDKNSILETSETAKDTLNNPLINKMEAAQKKHIIYLNTTAWYISTGGIRATEIMIDEIEQAIE